MENARKLEIMIAFERRIIPRKLGIIELDKISRAKKCIKIRVIFVKYAQRIERFPKNPEFDRKKRMCIMGVTNNETTIHQ